MQPLWQEREALIVVKTYPSPAWNGVEVSCTAAVDNDGNWMRIFPVPFRFLSTDKRFQKYQRIRAKFKKSSDARPESHHIDIDSIQVLSEPLSTAENWYERRQAIQHLVAHCMCCIRDERERNGFPTLESSNLTRLPASGLRAMSRNGLNLSWPGSDRSHSSTSRPRRNWRRYRISFAIAFDATTFLAVATICIARTGRFIKLTDRGDVNMVIHGKKS
jgi:hypothetical protein